MRHVLGFTKVSRNPEHKNAKTKSILGFKCVEQIAGISTLIDKENFKNEIQMQQFNLQEAQTSNQIYL